MTMDNKADPKLTTGAPGDKPGHQLAALDLPPLGWFALDVMRKDERKRDWVALMVDVHPDDLKTCTCDFPARFYVHPEDYRPEGRTARQCWVLIPGKHRNREAAWGAFHDMMATRH
jgi:hypothetical protein